MVVVGVGEFVDERLELVEVVGAGLGFEVFLEGLLETLDFSAGGGVVGRGVLLFGAEVSEAGLEGVASSFPAGEAGGVDHGVVGEHRRGNPVLNTGLVEGVNNDGAGYAPARGDGQCAAGMVIEPGDDLGCGAVSEPPVGEVGLPHLIGQIGLEPDIGGPGPFLGVGLHETQIDETAPDRRWRHGDLVVLLEVPANGVGAGVEALGGQL